LDFLVVPTINFRLLSVLVILRHERRRLISLSVTDHPTAEWIAQQITEAFPWGEAPTHLIRDGDSRYGQLVRRRMAAMDIRYHPTARHSPWQNGHAERLIGSLRRACLDHVVILGEDQCAESSRPMSPPTTMRDHTSLWARTRRQLARSNGLAGSLQDPSWADFITSTLGRSPAETRTDGVFDKDSISDPRI
jgi:transposase InsO family protein